MRHRWWHGIRREVLTEGWQGWDYITTVRLSCPKKDCAYQPHILDEHYYYNPYMDGV